MKQNELKHFGVLGMRWGHRKAQDSGGSGGGQSTGRKVLTKATDVLMGKAGKAALARDVDRARTLAAKVGNSVAFKRLVYDKNDTVGLIFKKSEVDKLKNFMSGTRASLSNGFHKWQVSSQDRDIKVMREIGNKLKDSKNPREQKLAKEHLDAADTLERDLNDTYTPEELKKYRGE